VSARSSRRAFLIKCGGAIAAAAAFPATGWARPAARRATGVGFARFVSQPALQPPTIAVTTSTNPSPGYLLVAALNGPGQRGPLMVDNRGEVVWFRPTSKVAINLQAQQYKGRPVLTWWEGDITQTGTGQGVGVIVDQTYKEVTRVSAGNGYQADVHEFILTPQGTALLTIFSTVRRDLSAVGGQAAGNVLDSIFQEVDVATGKVLFEWHSLDHVPLTDTYAPVLDPFDYFHLNSLAIDPLDGNFVISARNTSAIYKLDRRSGAVLWRLGGRSSDFALGPETFFMYQHDARPHLDGTLTLYDDGPSPSSAQSRALRLALDTRGMHAQIVQQYVHPTPLASSAMGNAQVLADDGVVVGWGTEPYLTEFGPAGDVRWDAHFVGSGWNYRVIRAPWVGRPTSPPALHAARSGGATTVHVSWNGSTETAFWQLAAGASRGALKPAKTVARSGFETAATVPGHPAFVSATPLDRAHRPLAAPRVVPVPR
jgi:hypothetical protein